MRKLSANLAYKQELRKLKDIVGNTPVIYKLTNVKNGKVYIGQSIQFKKRATQYRIFYPNVHLDRAVKKYGLDNFIISIVELNPVNLNTREKYWIKRYKSDNSEYGYNKTEGGDVSPIGEETKLKLSLASPRRKKVYQFNPDGKLIKIWNCVRDIERELKITATGVAHVCRNSKYSHSYKGFIWSYRNKFPKHGRVGWNSKKVRRLSNPTVDYLSAGVAGKLNKLAKTGITRCCKGKQKTCGGYRWIYI